MSEEDFIISVYCLTDEMYKELTKDKALRQRGPHTALQDPEVITMLIVGEYLGLKSDKNIWSYFKRHWQPWFPKIPCRTSFTRQASNLHIFINQMQARVSETLTQDEDLYLFDGFPIPVCHIKRYKRHSPFRGEGSVGYCASKDEKYFGFKGHLLITPQGVTKDISIVPANIDERDVLPEVVDKLGGDVIADKGLIRPELSTHLAAQGLMLHTPLRKNMKEQRPKKLVNKLMNIRRKIETVIGQLVERFHIQAIRAKDMWHLTAKIGRKILAHTVSFLINKSINPDNPLQISKILNY